MNAERWQDQPFFLVEVSLVKEVLYISGKLYYYDKEITSAKNTNLPLRSNLNSSTSI